jgi:hypothetical protein
MEWIPQEVGDGQHAEWKDITDYSPAHKSPNLTHQYYTGIKFARTIMDFARGPFDADVLAAHLNGLAPWQ